MKGRLVQCLLVALALHNAGAEPLQVGAIYTVTVTDVDQRQLSTSDGHVTLLCAVTRANQHDARAVGDRTPRLYYGDPKFRMITVVNLSSTLATFRILISKGSDCRTFIAANTKIEMRGRTFTSSPISAVKRPRSFASR
jgi:hypothetical protein